jgi:Cu-processing system ATP-binding protein
MTMRFGGLTAVNDLSFDVREGEITALIGPNGAGKTTTLKLLLGLARPDAGHIGIGPMKRPPADAHARHDLGYVPQRVEFAPGRTVAEVLGFFAALRGLPAGAVGAALARVGLEQLAGRRASTLSGGYTQRLSLAQALLGDPALLVLDEPTASLDPEATWEFRTLLESLRREGRTILLCSHLLAEVERVADRVLILVAGRCAALERIDDLRARQLRASRLTVTLERAHPGVAEALAPLGVEWTLESPERVSLAAADGRGLAALERLRATGAAVRTFEIHRPTLEEAFLEVVRGGHHEDR